MFRSPSHFAAHHYGRPNDLGLIAGAGAATSAAIGALLRRDKDLAARLWESVDGEAQLEIWDRWNARSASNDAMVGVARVDSIGPPTKEASKRLMRVVYDRDGYRCRYCGIDVFRRTARSPIVELIAEFPGLTPGLTVVEGALQGTGKSGAIRNVDYAKFLFTMVAPEHVFPRSLGGATDESNLVTSCWGCNAWKGDYTLEQIGVRSPF